MTRGNDSPGHSLRRRSTAEVVRGHDERLIRVFRDHDVRGSGRLSKAQLRSALCALGALKSEASDASLERLVNKAVGDSERRVEGELTLAEFKSLFNARRLKQLFDSVDRNGSGTLSPGELRAAFGRILDVDAEEARRMVASIDTKKTGDIDFEEFFGAFEFVPAADLKSVARRWHHLSSFDAGTSDLLVEDAPGLTLAQTVLSGSAASIASRTATAPFERLKIEAQTSASPLDLVQEARRIVRNEGFLRGLFRGHLLNCLRAVPLGALGFTSFVNLLDLEPAVSAADARLHELWRVACAVVATCLVTTLTYPLDVLRTRWTVLGGGSETTVYVSPKSLTELLWSIKQTEGLASLFRGLGPALLACGPFVAVQQCALDLAKSSTIDRGLCDGTQHHPVLLAAIGALSGIVAQTVTYPLEVVRRRMQLGEALSVASGDPVPNRTWPALRQLVREDGIRGLYHGILPTYLMVTPSCATGYYVAASLIAHFKRNNAGDLAAGSPAMPL